jgi:hypothetical protein
MWQNYHSRQLPITTFLGDDMSGLFSKPKAPPVTQAPPTPIIDQVQVDRNQADLLRRRRGRAATDLTSSAPAATTAAGTTGAVASQTLLGS